MKFLIFYFVLFFQFTLFGQHKIHSNFAISNRSEKNHKKSDVKYDMIKGKLEYKASHKLTLNRENQQLLKTSINSEGYQYDYIIYNWDVATSAWLNSERYINTYDDNLNEIESLYQTWDDQGKVWINVEKYISVYDEFGNWLSYQRLNSSAGAWVFYFQYLTTYNSQNNITEDLLQIWNEVTSKWDDYSIYKYEYDTNGNNLVYINQDWNGLTSKWENIWQHLGVYENNNLLMTDTYQEWSTTKNTWENITKTDYQYDAQGNSTSQLIKIWDTTSSQWINSSNHKFIYNASNQNTEYYYEFWDEGSLSWLIWYRDIYTYDNEGNQLSYFSQDWDIDNSIWINYEQAFFTYNAEGFPIGELYQDWDLDLLSWVNSTKVDYTITPIVSIKEGEIAELDLSFKLHQNYPNPFNPSTRIDYTIQKKSFINISIFNSIGGRVLDLVSETKEAGNYSILFNAASLSSGSYFVRISSNVGSITRKMVLLK